MNCECVCAALCSCIGEHICKPICLECRCCEHNRDYNHSNRYNDNNDNDCCNNCNQKILWLVVLVLVLVIFSIASIAVFQAQLGTQRNYSETKCLTLSWVILTERCDSQAGYNSSNNCYRTTWTVEYNTTDFRFIKVNSTITDTNQQRTYQVATQEAEKYTVCRK